MSMSVYLVIILSTIAIKLHVYYFKTFYFYKCIICKKILTTFSIFSAAMNIKVPAAPDIWSVETGNEFWN